MHKLTKIFGATTVILFSAATSAAADMETVVTPLIQNAFFVPYWFFAAIVLITIGVLIVALTRPTNEALPMNILGFFLAAFSLGASFITGDYMAPIAATNITTTVQDGIAIYTQTSETVIPLVLHQNFGTLAICLGLLTLSLLFLVARIFQYVSENAEIIDGARTP